MKDTQVTEEQTTETTQTTDEVTAAPEVVKDASDVVVAGKEEAGTEPVPQFTPEYTFKHNGKIHEIDEMWKPLIKDPDSQVKVRDFLQRAAATEDYKTKIQETEEKIQQWEPIVSQVEKLQQHFEAKNYERVLQDLGFTDDMIFDVARKKLERSKQPPEVQELHTRATQAELERERILAENQMYKERMSNELAQTTAYQLDMELEKPDYRGLVEAYDRANGPGAFKQMVIDRGSFLVQREGRHITPQELMPMIAKDFRPFMQPVENQAVAQKAKLKVIPTVSGRGTSPEAAQIKSIDDLRKKREQLVGSEY